jgi:CRP-like cAMP-binding protein
MAELNIIEKVLALEAVDLFKNLNAEQLAAIASIAKEIHTAPGKGILEANQAVDSLYVILDGEVDLRRDGQSFYQAKRGEVLGSWALFDPTPNSVGANAISDVRLLRISRTDFYELLSDNMQITQQIFSTLVNRFRQLAGG